MPVSPRNGRQRREAGAVVREKRERKGLSQRLLGERIGVTQATVSQIERGAASASITLDALRELGNVPRELRAALEGAL